MRIASSTASILKETYSSAPRMNAATASAVLCLAASNIRGTSVMRRISNTAPVQSEHADIFITIALYLNKHGIHSLYVL